MKKIRVFLFAASLLMFYGCANFLNEKFDFKDTFRERETPETDTDTTPKTMARVFNTTSDSTGITAPDWNVIFPTVLNKDFYLYKGIVQDGQIDYSASTTGYKSFKGRNYDYERNGGAAITSYYVSSTDELYLSSDDDGTYAYQMQSYDGTSTSELFYPNDIISVKCKSFEKNATYYSWEFEFSEQPDSLYFVQGTSNVCIYKSFWKLPGYHDTYSSYFYEFEELDSASSNFTTSREGYEAAIFAKYGDYYVRVTPVLDKDTGDDTIEDTDDGTNSEDMVRIFNITSDSTDSTAPNWNVFFPPVANVPVFLYKGIVEDGQVDYKASTTETKTFDGRNNDYVNLGWAAINAWHIKKSDTAYLSPDDDDTYAYQIRSYDGSVDVRSELIYPKDITAIKCKYFKKDSDSSYSWEFEFSEQPDKLYFVRGGAACTYRSFWKLHNYINADRVTEYEELSPTESRFTSSSIGENVAIFAKYGNYYIRVTPVLNEYVKVFNVTSSYNSDYAPNGNVIFPPALDKNFDLYKGIANGEQIDYNAGTTKKKTFKGSTNESYDDYSYIDYYVKKSDSAYISPDDNDGYAYQIDTNGTKSELIYPKDMIKIECKEFYALSGGGSYTYFWDIDFGKEPDKLYFVTSTSKSYPADEALWKLHNKSPSMYSHDYEELEPTATSYSGTATNYIAVFARWGNYYVRVTPVLWRDGTLQ
ncbi:MAG: hypothetical protein J1E60_08435 [Christensenellaceae bacterium]|nr:hypothetical protein [Christensenellaceae bacterium]